MNYSTYLEYIESNIDDVVTVQKRVKKLYKNLDKDSLDDIADIKQGLQDEKDILNGLMNNLNGLFGIRPSWHRQGFRIVPMELSRYKIKCPRVDKSSTENMLLKKLKIKMHEKHLLCDGMVGYAYSSVESHMWEIPNEIPDDTFIRRLRRTLQ